MEKVETSEITLRIPPSIAADIKNSEIVGLLLDKSLGKRNFYNKIGLDVALEALREAIRGRKCTIDEMWRYNVN